MPQNGTFTEPKIYQGRYDCPIVDACELLYKLVGAGQNVHTILTIKES